MGRRGSTWTRKVKRFMALLKRNDCEDSPQTKLLDEAEMLCKNLQHTSRTLEKLVKAMQQGRHWGFFLNNIHIVRASVLVHIRSSQYDVACKLLENCRAIEKEELVQLWNEIHYHKTMEKWHKQSLTPVQKFRCRKRNPPPASLCPEGVKKRNYPKEIRQMLQRFAVEITATPSRQQREALVRATNLKPQHIYNWFANYRRRQNTRPNQPKEPVQSVGIKEEKSQAERTEGHKSPAQNTGPLFCYQDFPKPAFIWFLGEIAAEARVVAYEMERPDLPSPIHPGTIFSAQSPVVTMTAPGGLLKQSAVSDRLHEGSGLEQMEMPLVSSNPSWELEDKGQVCSSNGTFLLPGSILQNSHLESFGSSSGFMYPIGTKEHTVFCTQAEEQHGRNLGTSTVESRWEPASADTGLWMENSSYSSCLLHPARQCTERLSVSRIPSEATPKADQYSLWSMDTSCVRSACCRMSPSVHFEARAETVRDQSENEGLVLNERQQGSFEAPMPCRCPVVSMPYPEESQIWAHEQMCWDPSNIDTLQAAWLLCELSCSNHL